MNTITISREFGSRDRELGKRLADLLGYDYYDCEVITAIASQSGLDETYVEKALENHAWQTVPLPFHHSFAGLHMMKETQSKLLLEQRRIIKEIAKAGKYCVRIGCNADSLLAEEKPFRMFICAEMEAKIHRYLERAPEGEHLSQREMKQNIRHIDRRRARTHEMLANDNWKFGSAYILL